MARRQRLGQQGTGLARDAGLRLAAIPAAGLERAAQRADRARIGRAVRHVLRLELVLADGASDGRSARPSLPRRAGDVKASLGDVGNGGRHHKGDEQGKEGRKRLQRGPNAPIWLWSDDRRSEHRADPDRVDVIEMRALELDAGGAQADAC